MFARILLNVILAAILMIPALAICAQEASGIVKGYQGYAGSVSCRECHEKFYKLWAPSHHGLAMQPYASDLARRELSPQTDPVLMGAFRYRAETDGETGWVIEQGPEGEKKYPMIYALGGKNVHYFLTPMERGRLQVLPIAYDVRKKEWFDMAASGVRHFPGSSGGEPVNWKEWPYTFNTACYSCHVSQLSTNYDLQTDTYHTVWTEPGINCETCHGPAEDHIRVCKEIGPGRVPKDLQIIRGGRDFTHEQNNDTCAPCHAKMSPLTTSFKPGDRYLDHYDLVALENPDFYPDGRDLGENYTFTLWRMSPCAKSGKLDCLHCHTSSGRYRFKAEEKANDVCMPCHKERVGNAPDHTHHKAGSRGNQCISCHMPMTEFARMKRSDHSMLPPAPAATLAFQSPNACNLCHSERDAKWADSWVRKWRKRDYQKPMLYRAHLINAARKRDWKRLPEMLTYLGSKDRDDIYAASLIRLLEGCEDPSKWPAILRAIKDPSPLVRSVAAASLSAMPSQQSSQALIQATEDEVRLVRVRAAMALAGYPRLLLKGQDQMKVQKATQEFLASLVSRPDQWSSHYNLGNYYLSRGDLRLALAAYETALRFEPRAVMPLVNSSIVDARMGENAKAEEALRRALKMDPNNAAAHFNLGLLKAEQNDLPAAEEQLRAALNSDPSMAEAAYNLGVLLAKDRPEEAIQWCRRAHQLRATNPRYTYTLAFFLQQKGSGEEATRLLQRLIQQQPSYLDAYKLLGEVYEKQGKAQKAKEVYGQALRLRDLSPPDRVFFEGRLQKLSSPKVPEKQGGSHQRESKTEQ